MTKPSIPTAEELDWAMMVGMFLHMLGVVQRSLPWRRVRGRKATEGLRVGTGPHVAHVFRRGTKWYWRVYLDGFTTPQASKRAGSEVEAKASAVSWIVVRYL